MRTIVAGSRTITDFWHVDTAMSQALIFQGIKPTVVLCGMADGVDTLGRAWALSAPGVTVEEYPANWARYGKRAGHLRNSQMANAADALVAVWDMKSAGTVDMISQAAKAGLRIFIYQVFNP